MVDAASLALPFMVVTVLWFVSTGLVAMINHDQAPAARAALDALLEWTVRDTPAGGPKTQGP